MKRRNNTVYNIAVIALMIAIMFIFGFTPIGTINVGAFSITLMGIPLAVMAIVFGPLMGTIGGLIWGIISIIQAFTGDPTGTLLQQSVANGDITNTRFIFALLFMCILARMLTGFLTGLVFDLCHKHLKKDVLCCLIAAITTPIFNTFFFMSFFAAFFFNTPVMNALGFENLSNPFVFIFASITLNFLVELLVNAFAGSAISYGILKGAEKMHLTSAFPHFFVKKSQNN